MNILKLVAQIFLIYLLYKLVVNVIIPVYRSGKRMRAQFKEMQQTMQDQMENRQQQSQYNANAPKQTPASKEEDYIDYEEVK